eukprot:CAMPEP_0206504512 /NCGR_PEP_ID=MMETSP0324_2-20121206/55536_1 /ASSEMBLY_ACC=CAM_ASM_000836 /TAXON_ID=2866 /ORGANISM="Crypthecodinium cohnii, Strain Seligo" /LENGTH=70 /DNA_ID=CAMNT_0053993709 /DNA_START=74 /DNA_END=286 /DNA_ORIENTATION=+
MALLVHGPCSAAFLPGVLLLRLSDSCAFTCTRREGYGCAALGALFAFVCPVPTLAQPLALRALNLGSLED